MAINRNRGNFRQFIRNEITQYLNANGHNPAAAGNVMTLEYLVNNNARQSAPRSIDQIINHLSTQGMRLTYQQFQQTILVSLKQLGFIATIPRSGGGLYIPGSAGEAKDYLREVLTRIEKMISNAGPITQMDQEICSLADDLEGLSHHVATIKKLL